MKLKNLLAFLFVIALVQFTNAQEKPKTTDQILENAFKQAKKENKNVFIKFEASWCGWCKTMDAKMDQPSVKNLFNDNYIIEHLVVKERKNNKHLENKGSEDLLNKYGGERQGIPYYLIFDSEGNLLADSKMLPLENVLKGEGTNIGCPGTDDEIDAFIYKIEETSNLKKDDLKKIAKAFKTND